MNKRQRKKKQWREILDHDIVTVLAYFFTNSEYVEKSLGIRTYTPCSLSNVFEFPIKFKHRKQILQECKRRYGHKMRDLYRCIMNMSVKDRNKE